MATTLNRCWKFGSNMFLAEIPAHIGSGWLFFSYETAVAALFDGALYVTEQRHSNTTSRHINKFLAEWAGTPEKKPQEFFNTLAMGRNPFAQAEPLE